MRKKLTILILTCTIIFLAGIFSAFGQDKSSEMKDKKITLKFNKASLGVIFDNLIVKYDVAIGFEESTLDRGNNDYEFRTNLPYIDPVFKEYTSGFPVIKEHWFAIDAKDERLEDVLNNIVGQMKNYKWEINDDVVNIFPIKGRDERYEKLLNIKIENFKAEKGKRIFLIRDNLIALPEVIKFLDENKLLSTRNRENFDFISRPMPVEMNFSNLTFRELLNKITKTKRGGWILKTNDRYGSKTEEFIEIEI